MVLCLSHTGSRTVAEALDYHQGPVIFSHSNPGSVWAHPRNISDELMRACAKKGGVVGLNGIGIFLGGGGHVLRNFLRHLHYAIDLVGPEHVGLGLDYVFDVSEHEDLLRRLPQLIPAGMDLPAALAMLQPEALGEITEDLARVNLTDAQIKCILGENWMRVASQVWR
jgi:membrane dipeptidase